MLGFSAASAKTWLKAMDSASQRGNQGKIALSLNRRRHETLFARTEIPMKTLHTLSASPFALQFHDLFQELDIVATHFDSARNLHRALKEQKPDIFIGEFVYAWGNDYAGNTISNLDVTLRTLQAAAPRAKLIVVMQASEAAHIDKLLALFPVHAALILPCTADALRNVLKDNPD
jgi:hypothetical protein